MMNNNFSKFETGINVNRVNKDVFAKKEEVDDGKKKVTNIFDKIIFGSLFMLFFGVPLFFTGLTFQGVVFEKQIYFYFWVLIALVSWAAKGAVTGEMKIRRTPLDIPIGIFLVVYVIATFFSVDKWHSFWGFFGDPSRGLMNILSITVVYYLMLSNFNKKTLKWTIGGLIASSALISIFSLLVFFGIGIVPASLSAFIPLSLIGTVSGLKIFLGMMIPIIVVASFKMNESKKKIINILGYVILILIPINLLLISMLFEKTISLIILFGIGFFLLYVLSHVVRPKENLTWIPMVVFVLAMIVLMVGQNNLSKVAAPVEVAPNMNVSWEIAKGGLGEDPIIGSGPATYGFNFSKYKPQSFNENIFYGVRFYQGTGLFFEALSTMGVLGLVSFLALVIVFINISIYLISKDKEKNKIYSLGVLSATMIIVISSLLYRVEGTIILLGGLLGSLAMAIIFLESTVEERYLKLSLKASPKFALTLAFIFIIVSAGVATLFVYIGKAYVADIYAGQALREKEVTETGSVTDLVKAINLNNKEGRYYSRAGQEFMILANQEALKDEGNINADKLQLYINNAVSYAKEGVNRMPNDALAVSVLAQIYESLSMHVADALEMTAKSYQDLLALEPHNPVSYLKLGQIKIVPALSEKDETTKNNSIKEAKELFEKSIAEKKNFADGYYYLAVTQNALGQKDEALNSLVEAVRNNKNNLTYLFNLARAYQEKGGEMDLDNAQKIYEYILTVNPEELNTIFAIGTLYEKKGEKDKSIEKYNKVIEIVSESEGDNTQTITQLNKMIQNVRNGVSNSDASIKQPEQANDNQQTNQNQNVELIGPNATQDPINTPANSSITNTPKN